MTPETDAHLVARVLDGDADGYAVLVGRYQASLFRYAVGMVRDGDLAADLVQDSLVKAYTSLATCQDPNRFGAWVFRILVNRCKDHLKSRRRHTAPLEEDTATAPDSDDPALGADRADTRALVERALATLPAAQREAFLLKHLEGRSYEEMAEMLGVSISALKMRVLRAREALQSLLREFAD
ncbi:MAG TPA: sigma-70 family RNA polymerase sigma factor [Longimicrobiaceae bacterium]|nr:sigma-70 family RNA polymerase sigma factor [Longimicrobiaceae bacterium]